MDNNDFYKNIKQINNLEKISQNEIYEDFPDDWFVIATDVKSSTKAITEGKYKEVNMVGAISIISILNLDKSIQIPFVFGGDGAFILIPPFLYKDSVQALIATQEIAKTSYDLHLRIAIIPVKELYEKNKKLQIARYTVSKDFSQAIIKGGSLEYCDYLLKNNHFLIDTPKDENFKIDLSGLECRWEAINSPKDLVVSIIIKAKEESLYKQILQNLSAILGDKKNRHPLCEKNLKLSFNKKDLNVEASIEHKNSIKKSFFILKLKLINLLGKLLISYNIGQWGEYKNRIVNTSDTEKFDDILRMTVSANTKQYEKLKNYLQDEYEKKNIFYGLHKSDSSMMTCLIFQRHGSHIHFIDATNGGYALAAKMLKKQIN